MNTLQSLKQIKHKIEQILISDIFARDDDNRLFDLVWKSQAKNLKGLNYNQFIILLKNGTLSPPESIRRARQKIQELNPNTRGLVYFKRKKMVTEYKALLDKYHKI